jgi:hypothetical protein
VELELNGQMEWRSRWGTYRGGLQCWQQVAHAACVTLPRAVALAATLRAGRGSWSSMATEGGVAFPLSPPSSGCWGLSSACLRVTPPLHLHVLRRQHRHGLLCVTGPIGIGSGTSFEDESRLLEELGINTRQIWRKTISILNPLRSDPLTPPSTPTPTCLAHLWETVLREEVEAGVRKRQC